MINEIYSKAKERMEKALQDLNKELSSIRTGRASVHLLNHIKVDYYGSPTPLTQVATLHVPEPTSITVQPWDVSQVNSIDRAIRMSSLGLNPSNDGRIIRIPIPPLTQERRQTLAKQVGKIAEEHRTAVRQVRRDANDQLKKEDISEDEKYKGLDKIQKITDQWIERIDISSHHKEKEILEV